MSHLRPNRRSTAMWGSHLTDPMAYKTFRPQPTVSSFRLLAYHSNKPITSFSKGVKMIRKQNVILLLDRISNIEVSNFDL